MNILDFLLYSVGHLVTLYRTQTESTLFFRNFFQANQFGDVSDAHKPAIVSSRPYRIRVYPMSMLQYTLAFLSKEEAAASI